MVCIRCDGVFKNYNCNWLSKKVVSCFYRNVKIQHAAAPHVLKPVGLNLHSVITDSENLLKFHIYRARIMGKTTGVLKLPSRRFCTELSILSTIFLSSPGIYSMLKLSAISSNL